MAKEESKTEKKEVKKETKKVSRKPKMPTREYTLINGVSVSGQWKAKGEKVKLTDEGYKYFKSIKKVR